MAIGVEVTLAASSVEWEVRGAGERVIVDAESEWRLALEALFEGLSPAISHFAATRPSLVIL